MEWHERGPPSEVVCPLGGFWLPSRWSCCCVEKVAFTLDVHEAVCLEFRKVFVRNKGKGERREGGVTSACHGKNVLEHHTKNKNWPQQERTIV
jgi:hypothetical protein